MRQKGKLRSWNDDRGFGFITPSGGGNDVFVHISALGNRNRRPEVGQIVSFALSTDEQGRAQAIRATLPGDRLPKRKRKSGGLGAAIIAGGFIALVALAVVCGKLPVLILWVYLIVSFITFCVYAADKAAAKGGAWRTQENTLHLLSLIGGWPGALIAQQTLRHKSKKQQFRIVFWMTVIVNLIAFAWLFTPGGAGTLEIWINEGRALIGSGQRATIEWAEPRKF